MVLDYNRPARAPTEEVIFLGAGFSHSVTSGRIPLLAGLLTSEDLENCPATAEVMHRCFPQSRTPTFEEALTFVDPFAASPLYAATADPRWSEIRRQAYTELETLALSRLQLPVSFDERDWAANWLRGADELTTVITTNYDVLSECLLSQRFGACDLHDSARCHPCRMRALLHQYDTCRTHIPRAPATHVGALLKLHGSLAWARCANYECVGNGVIVADPGADDTAMHHCGCCGGKCVRVIVPATKAKRFEHMPFLCTMWDAARLALREARRFVMFGYSLPEGDTAVLDLLADSFNSGRLEEIVVIDPFAEGLAHRLQRLAGRRLRSVHAISDCRTESKPAEIGLAGR